MSEQTTGSIVLKKGREKPLVNRHPWIFSGAIQRVVSRPGPGDLVDVQAANGDWLACAYYNPQSQIPGRVLAWNADQTIDETFWQQRLQTAFAGREALQIGPQTSAYRLVNAESDGLPGLVVDQYNDFLVVQCLTLGINRRKELLFDLLAALRTPAGIIERSDVDVRRKEGLYEVVGVPRGQTPPGRITILENGHRFQVSLLEGHKTGLYLDQRENRALVGQSRFMAGREVLNLFAYTGGFAVYAAAAGASAIVNVDSSADLLVQAQHNLVLNGHDTRPGDEYVNADAFQLLRRYRDSGRQFDTIILDPPKFAHSKGDVERACRGYKDLNWLAMRLTRPGGHLATFSCSGLVSADLFQKVLFGAAVDAGRDVQILYQMGQAADHPIALTFPESAYLKGFLLRVL